MRTPPNGTAMLAAVCIQPNITAGHPRFGCHLSLTPPAYSLQVATFYSSKGDPGTSSLFKPDNTGRYVAILSAS